jgi:glycine cleavage system regulatory protein
MVFRRSHRFKIAICFLAIFTIGILIIANLEGSNKAAGAIVLSAILALYSATITVVYNRLTAREKNSLEFQESLQLNTEYKKHLITAVRAIEDRFTIPLEVLTTEEYKRSESTKAIQYVLNTWERAANAMHHGIYDEVYLYGTYKSKILYFGIHLRDFVKERQKDNPAFYQNYSHLVLLWAIRGDSFEEKNTKTDLKKVFNDLNSIKHGKRPK